MTPADIIARAVEEAFHQVALWHDKNARLCLEASKDDPRMNADDRRRAFEAHRHHAASLSPTYPAGMFCLSTSRPRSNGYGRTRSNPTAWSSSTTTRLLKPICSASRHSMARWQGLTAGGWVEIMSSSQMSRAPRSGLDDGPPLNEPRKRAELKPADVMRDIRDKAWATRRAKYGERGHR